MRVYPVSRQSVLATPVPCRGAICMLPVGVDGRGYSVIIHVVHMEVNKSRLPNGLREALCIAH